MARTFNGTNQYLNGAAVTSSAEYTVSLWFKTSNLTNFQVLFSRGSTVASTGWFRMSLRGDQGGDYTEFYDRNGADLRLTGPYPTGSWVHMFASSGSGGTPRNFRVNNVQYDQSAGTTSSSGTANLTTLGAWFADSGTPQGYFDGSLSDVAMWNVALSNQDCAALFAGASPLSYKPQNLLEYWPLGNDVTPGLGLFGTTLTNTGTTATVDQPRIYPTSQTQ